VSIQSDRLNETTDAIVVDTRTNELSTKARSLVEGERLQLKILQHDWQIIPDIYQKVNAAANSDVMLR
jgi:hypothetical protein